MAGLLNEGPNILNSGPYAYATLAELFDRVGRLAAVEAVFF